MKRFLQFVFLVFFCSFCAVSEDSVEKSEKSAEDADINAVKKVSLSKGFVGIDLFSNQGTFGLYAVNSKGSKKAVLSSRSAFASSGFYLRSGKSVYQLNKAGGIPSVSSTSENVAKILYTVRKGSVQADVAISFEILKCVPNSETEDLIKVTIETKNTGSRRQIFGIRGIFDTVLGEMSETDFSTAQVQKIDSEFKFDTMTSERLITSKNYVNAMQILLAGREINSPKSVILANKDVILAGDWEGFYYKEGRAFSSILSYQNSAVDIVWDDFALAPAQKTSIVFYIALSAEGIDPAGMDFLDRKVYVENSVENPIAYPAVSEIPVETYEPTEEIISVPYDKSLVTKEQLDPAYIQALLDKINLLEDSDNSIDRQTLANLNSELDAILDILKNQ